MVSKWSRKVNDPWGWMDPRNNKSVSKNWAVGKMTEVVNECVMFVDLDKGVYYTGSRYVKAKRNPEGIRR